MRRRTARQYAPPPFSRLPAAVRSGYRPELRAVHVTRDGDNYHCEETGEDWTEPPMFTIVPPEPFEDWPETGDPNHDATPAAPA